MDRSCSALVRASLVVWLVCGVLWIVDPNGVRGQMTGPRPQAVQVAEDLALSAETVERWCTWMRDPRTPCFWMWSDPSSGRWQVGCHIVPRLDAVLYRTWREESGSLEAALRWVLNAMDREVGR